MPGWEPEVRMSGCEPEVRMSGWEPEEARDCGLDGIADADGLDDRPASCAVACSIRELGVGSAEDEEVPRLRVSLTAVTAPAGLDCFQIALKSGCVLTVIGAWSSSETRSLGPRTPAWIKSLITIALIGPSSRPSE